MGTVGFWRERTHGCGGDSREAAGVRGATLLGWRSWSRVKGEVSSFLPLEASGVPGGSRQMGAGASGAGELGKPAHSQGDLEGDLDPGCSSALCAILALALRLSEQPHGL